MGDLPQVAAWRHVDAREGFEVLFLGREGDGYRLEGHSTGLERDEAWAVRYSVVLDAAWTTRSAHVSGRLQSGAHEVRLEGDGEGRWTIDGAPAPDIAGCRDVDLEASACTNALPVNRLRLAVGERADAPAAWVRFDLRVERLEQTYSRLEGEGEKSYYDYEAPNLDFASRLVYDPFGLVLNYPGIAVRVV